MSEKLALLHKRREQTELHGTVSLNNIIRFL